MEGTPPPTDYAAMLADMEAKYLALGNAIASLRALLGTGALGLTGDLPAGPSPGGQPASVSLPRGAFLGKKAPEAIKLYLSAVRKKQTNKEIAQALKDGGLESTGNFDNYVTGGLFRLKNDGVVLRFDDGWGLAEWYPEAFRTRVGEKSASGKRKGRKKTGNKAKDKKAVDAKAPAAPPKAKSAGLEEQILGVFSDYGGSGLDADIVSDLLGVNKGTVNLALGRLAAKGKIEKTALGYNLAAGNVQEIPTAKAS